MQRNCPPKHPQSFGFSAGTPFGSGRSGLANWHYACWPVPIRYFGPANFGMYSMALAVGWVANAVIDLGLTRYAARAVAASAAEATPILSLTLFTTVGSALITGIALLFAMRTGNAQLACLAAGFVLCNFEGTSSLCGGISTADLRSKAILPGSIFGAGGLILMTVITLWLHLSVLALLSGLCLKSTLVMCLRLWQLRAYWPADWSLLRFKGVAYRALPFFANNLTQVGYWENCNPQPGSDFYTSASWLVCRCIHYCRCDSPMELCPKWSIVANG